MKHSSQNLETNQRPASPQTIQNSIHEKLSTYINGARFSKLDSLAGLIAPAYPFKRYSKQISSEFENLIDTLPSDSSGNNAISIPIESYSGNCKHVSEMQKELNTLGEFLKTALINGSLAEGTEIAFSDFDAILVLRNDTVTNAKKLENAALSLYRLRRIMHAFDPLQHHGWIVLTEFDLQFYCSAYFPVEALKHCKSLLSPVKLQLFLRDDKSEAIKTFDLLSKNVLSVCEKKTFKNLYKLKAFLSAFMLLPATFWHATEGHGIYKRDSFEATKEKFDAGIWDIMDEVSEWRHQWIPTISPAMELILKKTLNSRSLFLSRSFSRTAANRLVTPEHRKKIAALTMEMRRQALGKN